jgi:hypothetical protein
LVTSWEAGRRAFPPPRWNASTPPPEGGGVETADT